MFACGDKVVYGIHGVCVVVDVEKKIINRKPTEYFVLEPIEQPGSRYYIPVHNQIAVSKLQPILSRDELEALISSDDACKCCWIDDENQRKQHYRHLINSGDRLALIAMVHTLYKHRSQQLAAGRKFHLCDENFLKDAEKLLSVEFSLVLGISPGEVGEYIRRRLSES